MTAQPAEMLRTFADAEAVLATALPGYEPRPPQQRLAERIEAVFANEANFEPYRGEDSEYWDWEREGVSHLCGQAGCGTGKSLAYLIPALLSGRRVVVSVTTKALQDQIVASDMPFLSEHLGQDFRWALLKGRSNYLCTNRLKVVTEQDAPVEVLRAVWEATKVEGFNGFREEIPADIPDKVWALIASESEECSANKCKAEDCYAARARAKALEADVVIANHSLLFTDLLVKTRVGFEMGMLGAYDLVVCDEAHSLEEVAGNSLGDRLTLGTFANHVAQVRRWSREFADDDGALLLSPLEAVEQAAEGLFAALPTGSSRGAVLRLRTAQMNSLVDEFSSLFDSLEGLLVALKDSRFTQAVDTTKASQKHRRLHRATGNLLSRVKDLIILDADETVCWVEQEERRNGTIKIIRTAPIHVGRWLARHLYSKTPVVMVSATLAVKGRMDYIAGRLGVDQFAYDSIDVGTPFDFAAQGKIYVPVNIPAPQGQNTQAWQAATLHEIHRLVTASRGRALVLFTSIKHMRDTMASLERMGGDLNYRMQGERGATNGDLAAWLKEGVEGRVLLATKSFFTGIDIPGEALSLLVISKMPFPVPTEPLTEARCEAIERNGGSSFADYTIPVMSLELQQGVGRLIRHRGDRGVAAILDPRLATKSYGKQILRDLPPMRQHFTLGEVETALRAL